MSKSYGNDIPLFASPKEVEKRIKEIKTDSKGLDDAKDPASCVVFQMLQAFGSPEAVSHMRERLERGTGYGYGHAKKDLLDEYNRFFGSRRELFDHYRNSPTEIAKALEPGQASMVRVANAVRDRARDALGLLKA
jgi:tryptophanyl-tRNA synthetase